jgi:putative ABC transport system substrate-binding protein
MWEARMVLKIPRRLIAAALFVALSPAPVATGGAEQHTGVARLGVLLFGTPATDPMLGPFQAGLRELGYIEGRNLVVDYRYAEGRAERLPGLAAELVRAYPDVLVALGGDIAPIAKNATGSIPIAAFTSGDPIRGGLVASLNRPGGNLTGVTLLATDLAAKRLELLAEILPRMRRVAFLWNPDHADDDLMETRLASTALQVELVPLPVRTSDDLDPAFNTAIGADADALIVVLSRLTAFNAERIARFAVENRLPLVSSWGPWVKSGGLLGYGPNIDEHARRLAVYVDKMLRGANPADLPIEQPVKFELIVNQKAAKALGLTIPPALLARADEVIE